MKRKTENSATLAAQEGAKIINDTNPHVIEASLVVLSSDAVVALLEINGVATDVKADYITTPASAVGMVCSLAAENEGRITKIQLSAGSANYAI